MKNKLIRMNSKKPETVQPKKRNVKTLLFMSACFSVMLIAPDALANTMQTWLAQPTATGNWGGVRSSLLHAGVKIHLEYQGQSGWNISGGKRIGADYNQQITLGADWDLHKLLGWPSGGILHSYVESRAGREVAKDYVGSNFMPDGLYGSGENFRLMNLSYEQQLFSNRLNILAGYYPLSTQFGSLLKLCSNGFMSNAFCHPQFLSQDTGYQPGPVAEWGGRVKVFLTPADYVEVGAFENKPILTHNNQGWDISPEGAQGVLIPIQLGHTLFIGPMHLVGHYSIGGIIDTIKTNDIEDPHMIRSGRYAGYINIDQQLWKAGPSSQRNVMMFTELGIADKQTAPETFWLAAGISFTGLLPQRPGDILNIGYARATENSRALDAATAKLRAKHIYDDSLTPAQSEIEVGYNIKLAPWFYLTPDFQYLMGVGTRSFKHIPNATVVGLGAKLVF